MYTKIENVYIYIRIKNIYIYIFLIFNNKNFFFGGVANSTVEYSAFKCG